jgi:hypothetical protein
LHSTLIFAVASGAGLNEANLLDCLLACAFALTIAILSPEGAIVVEMARGAEGFEVGRSIVAGILVEVGGGEGELLGPIAVNRIAQVKTPIITIRPSGIEQAIAEIRPALLRLTAGTATGLAVPVGGLLDGEGDFRPIFGVAIALHGHG